MNSYFYFQLICSVLVGLGVWILLDRDHVSVLFGGSYMLRIGVITVVVTLCCFICVTLLGWFGARREHKCMLMTVSNIYQNNFIFFIRFNYNIFRMKYLFFSSFMFLSVLIISG